MKTNESNEAVYAAGERWYRYDYQRYSPGSDECGDSLPGTVVKLVVREFMAVKVTPKGVWIQAMFGELVCGDRHFILRKSHKKFAWPTLALAVTSFRARKAKEIAIYQRRIAIAQAALDLCEGKLFSQSVFVP